MPTLLLLVTCFCYFFASTGSTFLFSVWFNAHLFMRMYTISKWWAGVMLGYVWALMYHFTFLWLLKWFPPIVQLQDKWPLIWTKVSWSKSPGSKLDLFVLQLFPVGLCEGSQWMLIQFISGTKHGWISNAGGHTQGPKRSLDAGVMA